MGNDNKTLMPVFSQPCITQYRLFETYFLQERNVLPPRQAAS
jgi:hypothetical protein